MPESIIAIAAAFSKLNDDIGQRERLLTLFDFMSSPQGQDKDNNYIRHFVISSSKLPDRYQS